MIRVIAALALAGALLAGAPAEARRGDPKCDAPSVPSTFDRMFSAAARRHFPLELRDQWCVLKTICWIESRLNPDAASQVGAQGLCQVMPSTAGDLEKRGVWRGRLRIAKDNAEAAALVFAKYWRFWSTPRPGRECRLEVTLASYNAGPGNIAEAQAKAGGALCWERIRAHLREVTGRHARETIDYVSRFWEAWRQLRGHSL